MKRAIIDLHLDPRVYTIANFLDGAECRHLISRAKTEEMKRATVSGETDGVISDGRTNDVCWLDHTGDPACKRIAHKVSGLVGMPLSHAEKFQIIRYGVGAQYKPHFDSFDPSTPAGERNMKGGGQRLITVLGYLNVVAKGGSTDFPKLNISVPAEMGKLLVFHNCLPGTTDRHPLSLHAGRPVEEGEKWAFNLWFREGRRDY
ncbi:2OG-Fe(II) oxygenase [Kordiimonas sp.]|uniref:2OG-Fe(II) oxygenase n=1 Tax=Kordiimonas sp. TaxID=1970157 RepID=UPI003A91E2C8